MLLIQPSRLSFPSGIAALFIWAALAMCPSATIAQPLPQVATPNANPPSSDFDSILTVGLFSATPDVSIHYTLDGSVPGSGGNSVLYAGPISITRTTVVKAVAVKAGMAPSQVLASTYTLIKRNKLSAPLILPASGAFMDSVRVTMATMDPAADIYFILNGPVPFSLPLAHRMDPGSSLVLVETATLQAVAVKDGYIDSDVAVVSYVRIPSAIRAPGRAADREMGVPRRTVRYWSWRGRRLDGARP